MCIMASMVVGMSYMIPLKCYAVWVAIGVMGGLKAWQKEVALGAQYCGREDTCLR